MKMLPTLGLLLVDIHPFPWMLFILRVVINGQ